MCLYLPSRSRQINCDSDVDDMKTPKRVVQTRLLAYWTKAMSVQYVRQMHLMGTRVVTWGTQQRIVWSRFVAAFGAVNKGLLGRGPVKLCSNLLRCDIREDKNYNKMRMTGKRSHCDDDVIPHFEFRQNGILLKSGVGNDVVVIVGRSSCHPHIVDVTVAFCPVYYVY
jgi:hypothetical protein